MDKLARVLKFIDSLSINAGKLFSYLILVIIFFETAEVVLRYLFRAPTIWSWELCTILYGAVMIMGGAWVMEEQKHVRTDVIYSHVSEKTRTILDIVFSFIFFIFAVVMIWKSGVEMLHSWAIRETSYTTWGPPMYPLKTVVFFAFLFLGLQGLACWIRNLIFLLKGERI
ncbi:MAG: TRAP transporter small permease subunit [Dehalobacterium sp.]